ncbi:hypothetical protein Tco_0229719, partial [Tanacetum coccineum]
IDEEYERDCEIRIRKLNQDSNEWGSKVQKKEQAYEEEKYSAARRYMLSIPFVDEDDYIPLGDIIARYSTSKSITPDLSIEEPDNSLSMGDEHLDTTPIENLVPIPSEFEGISDSLENIEYVDASLSYIEYDSFEEKLLNVHRLISKIEFLKDNSTPNRVLESPSSFPIPITDSDSFVEESDTSLSHLDNSLPEFKTFSDDMEETRSGS